MSKYDKGPETIQERIDRLQDYYNDPNNGLNKCFIVQKIKELKQRQTIMAEKTVNVDMLDFFNYLDCRDSGVTNMFDITTVKSITGLSKEQIIYIIKNFDKLKEKYC